MKKLLKWLLFIGVPAAIIAVAYMPVMTYWKERNRIHYKEAEVNTGTIVWVVNSTGTVKPVRSVSIGAVVSGPIESLYVNFNDEVKKGDLLAKIDPRIYDANVARDRAALATRKADVDRAQALLQQAINDLQRAESLRDENKDFISDAEMDQFKFNQKSLEAQLIVAITSIEQAQASLDNSMANLGYTEIRSPVDGIVIDKKIDPGQSLASQFQTPELFVLAPEMRERMLVYASVDEADIGKIAKAQESGQGVKFTVDAYLDDIFEGEIDQIRKSSTTTQNVVTYPVIVAAKNEDLKLMPGMTANISFTVRKAEDVRRIPNAALRFYPAREQVREADRTILDGVEEQAGETGNENDTKTLSAEEKAELRRKRNSRHVWVVEGDFLKAIAVETGISDNKYTELVSGDLKVGQKLVTGIKPKTP